MRIYFAPMEGVTDVTYRRLHNRCFPGIDRYFMPFLSPSHDLTLTHREQRAIDPEGNRGVPVIPQLLTRDAGHFIGITKVLADLGYSEVNLNAGCPSGTVTAKGKGSGMLRTPDELDAFLDQVCAHSPLPVSVKTRIGYERPEEWERLLPVFARYPFTEVILHPRTRKEFYGGTPHQEVLRETLNALKAPLVYNGDLFTPEDCRAAEQEFPELHALMLGRGLIADPALARVFRGGKGITLQEIRDFHDLLYAEYQRTWQPNFVVGHMDEIMKYMIRCFEHPEKPLKAMRKAKNQSAYEDAVRLLFDTCPLRQRPYFELPFL